MSTAIETSVKTRESRARRALDKLGYRLQKTPARSWQRGYYRAGYMILRQYGNTVVAGASQREYEMTLDDVEDSIARLRVGGRP